LATCRLAVSEASGDRQRGQKCPSARSGDDVGRVGEARLAMPRTKGQGQIPLGTGDEVDAGTDERLGTTRIARVVGLPQLDDVAGLKLKSARDQGAPIAPRKPLGTGVDELADVAVRPLCAVDGGQSRHNSRVRHAEAADGEHPATGPGAAIPG
jgi:hypothetical protein